MGWVAAAGCDPGIVVGFEPTTRFGYLFYLTELHRRLSFHPIRWRHLMGLLASSLRIASAFTAVKLRERPAMNSGFEIHVLPKRLTLLHAAESLLVHSQG